MSKSKQPKRTPRRRASAAAVKASLPVPTPKPPKQPKRSQVMPLAEAKEHLVAALNRYTSAPQVIVAVEDVLEFRRCGKDELNIIRQAVASLQQAVADAEPKLEATDPT